MSHTSRTVLNNSRKVTGYAAEILAEYGPQALVGYRYLRSKTVLIITEILGEVSLKRSGRRSFLYFGTSDSRPMLYLFTVPKSQKIGPMEYLKFEVNQLCRLTRRASYADFGTSYDISFAHGTTTKYEYNNGAICEINNGQLVKSTSKREFLSAHADIYEAMRQTLSANAHRLITKNPIRYRTIMESINQTLQAIKGIKPAAVQTPPESKIKKLVNEKSPKTKAEIVRKLTIMPAKVDLIFSQVSRHDHLAHKPWGIKANYVGGEAEIHFDEEGQILKVKKRYTGKEWEIYEIGRRSDRTQGLGLEVSAQKSSGEGNMRVMSYKEYGVFVGPLLTKLAAHVKTLPPSEETCVLQNLIKVQNRLILQGALNR